MYVQYQPFVELVAYASRDASDGSEVFVKNMHKSNSIETLFPPPNRVQRYRREAQLLQRCSHNHIVGIKGFRDAETDSEAQLELELARYGSVQQFGTSGPEKMSTFGHRLEQLIQVVDALEYLHTTLHVVHGSVHLGHMLVFEREEQNREWPSGWIKLCGFGDAVEVGETGQPRTPLDCRPPESFTECSDFPAAYDSFASIRMAPSYDVYSVGRILLRWLLKIDVEREFREKHGHQSEAEYQDMVVRHVKSIQEGTCIQEAVERIPAWWKQLVLLCCQPVPSARISTSELKTLLIEGRQHKIDGRQ